MAIALKVQQKSERLMPLTGVIYVFVKTTNRSEISKKEPEEKVPSALFGYIFRLSKSRPSKLRASNSRLQPLGTSVLISCSLTPVLPANS